MALLPLLQDGSCGVANTCMTDPHKVHAQCPQTFKCGTCVAWSPREKNRYGRNSGQCMLDRTATVYLDCNAQICPYSRPRQDSPAHDEWVKGARPKVPTATSSKPRARMNREAPPPSAAALAQAAFRNHAPAVASSGSAVLEAQLQAASPLPVLLERFRGGTAVIEGAGAPREVPLEAAYARIVLLRRAIADLDEAIDQSTLSADEKDKLAKDLGGMGGSMTTFNILFKDKSDHFRGQGKA